MKLARLLILLTTIILHLSSQASNTSTPPTFSCEGKLNFSDFDFWIGEWEVFTEQGKKIGDNTISKQEKGCLILENWRDISGGTGQSYNFYNPLTNKWRQLWVSNVMTIDYQGSLTESGSMELIGEVIYFQNKQKSKLLGRWTPQADGSVKQFFAQYDEKQNKWVPVFTGIYRKKTQ